MLRNVLLAVQVLSRQHIPRLVFAEHRLASSHPLSPSEVVSEVPWFQPLPLGIKPASTKQHLLIRLNNIIQPFFLIL